MTRIAARVGLQFKSLASDLTAPLSMDGYLKSVFMDFVKLIEGALKVNFYMRLPWHFTYFYIDPLKAKMLQCRVMNTTIQKNYQVDRSCIGFIKFIFEAYEGVAIVSTIDSKTGHIRLCISPDLVETADMIIADLGREISFNAI